MDKFSIIKLWHKKAENDLKVCEQGLRADEIVTDVICFHCQQAVEKYLKSYLIYVDQPVIRTHNIAVLLDKCEKFDSNFSSLNFSVYMTEYAVQLRYPDDFFVPDLAETEKAYKDSLRIKEFILKKIKF